MKCPISPTLLTLSLLVASPALADHGGPGSGIASGGGLNTVSAGTMDEGHWAAAFRLSLARPDQLSDAELLSRDASGIDAHSAHSVSSSSLGIAYGVTHELTIAAELPYIRRADIRAVEDAAAVNRGSSAGFGDLTFTAKYKALHGDTWALALLFGVKAPTGATHRRDRAGDRFETEHQPGTGSWDPIAGVAASVALGSNAIDASWVYQKATHGAQHTRLGDRSQAGVAFSHRFGEHEPPHEHHHDDGDAPDHDHDDDAHERHASVDAIIELNEEWEGRERVAGAIDPFSGASVLWLSPGVRLTSKAGWSMSSSFGIVIAQHVRASHPNNNYRLSLSLGRYF